MGIGWGPVLSRGPRTGAGFGSRDVLFCLLWWTSAGKQVPTWQVPEQPCEEEAAGPRGRDSRGGGAGPSPEQCAPDSPTGEAEGGSRRGQGLLSD